MGDLLGLSAEGLGGRAGLRLPGQDAGRAGRLLLDARLPVLRLRRVGVDVQGTFWHYGQGSDTFYKDMLRKAAYEGMGLTIVTSTSRTLSRPLSTTSIRL
ncbi:MAG: hypothetical protein M5T61_09840 [Acidimicrobiia bacterium]|nr:hypothetical protein [Acidimicrobiia bacterium]